MTLPADGGLNFCVTESHQMNTPRYIKDMEAARIASMASQAKAKAENAKRGQQ